MSVHISIGVNYLNRDTVVNWFKENGIQVEAIPDSCFVKTAIMGIWQALELVTKIVVVMEMWDAYSVRIEKGE